MAVDFASYNQDKTHPKLLIKESPHTTRVFDFNSSEYAQMITDNINKRVEELIKEAVDAKEKEMRSQQSFIGVALIDSYVPGVYTNNRKKIDRIGCHILCGHVRVGSRIQVIRGSDFLNQEWIEVNHITHLLDDIKEAPVGMRCTLTVDSQTLDIKPGDVLQIFDVRDREDSPKQKEKRKWSLMSYGDEWWIYINDFSYPKNVEDRAEENRRKWWQGLPKPPENFPTFEEGFEWIKSVDPTITDDDALWIKK